MKDEERKVDELKERAAVAGQRMGVALVAGVLLALVSTIALIVSKLHTFAAY